MKKIKCDKQNEKTGAMCNLEKGHKGLHANISPLTKKIYFIGTTWK